MSELCYELTCCPQCHQGISTSTNRLVQDSCGHKKCRMCLLQEDNGCVACGNVSRYDTDHRLLLLSSHDMRIGDGRRRHSSESRYGEEAALPPPLEPAVTGLGYYPEEERKEDRFHHHTEDSPVERTASVESDNGEPDWPPSPPPPPPFEPDPPAKKPSVPRPKTKRKPIVVPAYVTVSEDSPPNYTCTICEKTFGARAHVRYHLYCDGKPKPHRCPSCGREFVAQSHFEYHLRTHDGHRPHVCPLCKKAFSQRAKLTRHARSHSAERAFVCSSCGRAFKNLDGLRSHRQTHDGERGRHECDACGRRFSLRCNLRKHALTHSGEKNYMCDECGRSFSLKCVLTVHIASHSRARPYACKQCPHTFAVRKDLVRHQTTHSDVRPFGCPLCPLSFPRKDNFLRHIKNNHQSHGLSPVTVAPPETPAVDAQCDRTLTTRNPSPCPTSEAACPEPTRGKDLPYHISNVSDSQEKTSNSGFNKSDIDNGNSHSDNASPYGIEHPHVVVNNFRSHEIKQKAELHSVTPSVRTGTRVIQQVDMSEEYRESCRSSAVTMSPNNETERSFSESSRQPIINMASSVEAPLPPRTLSYQAVPVINRSNVARAVESPPSSSIIKMGGWGEAREPSNCVRTITRTSNLQKCESPRRETPELAPQAVPSCEALGPELLGEDNPEKPTLRLYLSDVHWRKRIMELLNLKKEPTTDSLVYDKSAARTNDTHKERLVLNKNDGQSGDGGSKSSSGDGGRKSNARTPTHTPNSKYARSQSGTNSKLLQKVPSDNQSKIHSRTVSTKQEVHNLEPPIFSSNSLVHRTNDGVNETEQTTAEGNRDNPSLERPAHTKPVIVENKSIQHSNTIL